VTRYDLTYTRTQTRAKPSRDRDAQGNDGSAALPPYVFEYSDGLRSVSRASEASFTPSTTSCPFDGLIGVPEGIPPVDMNPTTGLHNVGASDPYAPRPTKWPSHWHTFYRGTSLTTEPPRARSSSTCHLRPALLTIRYRRPPDHRPDADAIPSHVQARRSAPFLIVRLTLHCRQTVLRYGHLTRACVALG